MIKFHRIFLLLIVLLITGLIYSLGIDGPFLYDDTGNLSTLQYVNNNLSFGTIQNFIFSNTSGPLGRPISMASFLLNSQTWPTSPLAFKITNIIIHLTCGLLIFQFIKTLLPIIEPAITVNRQLNIALVATCFWLLHPLHVSTTLYIVQRMTQLATLFTLLSLIAFIKLKPKLCTKTKILSFIWPSCILIILISLSVFSKENAILLFPALLLINYFDRSKTTNTFRIWFYGITLIPIIICIYKLLPNLDIYHSAFLYKGFTLVERLLTELRIVVHYLSQIIIPNANSMSIFHDDYIISNSLFTPISTLLSLSLICGLIGLLFTKINNIYKFSIAWFFIWHLLESTALPLDLYFEHRNYTAALGPLLALTYAIFDLGKAWSPNNNKLPLLTAGLISGVFALQLFSLTTIWAKEETLLTHWLTNHEKSKNTLLSLIQYYEKTNNLPLANKITLKAVEYSHLENDLGLHMKLYVQLCALNASQEQTLNKMIALSLRPANYSHSVISMNASIVLNVLNGNCKPDNMLGLHQLLNQIEIHSPQRTSARWIRDIRSKHAFLYLHDKKLPKALSLFKKAFHSKRPDIALAIIDISIKLTDYKGAQRWINIAKRSNKNSQLNISNEIQLLQKRLNVKK